MSHFPELLRQELLNRQIDPGAINEMESMYCDLTLRVADAPDIAALTGNDAPLLTRMNNLGDGETWAQFKARTMANLQSEIDLANPFLGRWEGKDDEHPSLWASDCGKISATGKKKINDLIRLSTPCMNDIPQNLLKKTPIADIDLLAEIMTCCRDHINQFVWPVGTGDNGTFRWGPSLCLLAGFGLDGVRYFAERMSRHEGDWQYWATCSDEELANDILEAQKTSGYAIGLLRVDFSAMSRILEEEEELAWAPKWYKTLGFLHIAKYCRYRNLSTPDALRMVLMYKGKTSERPLDTDTVMQPITADDNRSILKDFGSILCMPVNLNKSKNALNACPIAIRDMLSYVVPNRLISQRDPKKLVDWIPSPGVQFISEFRNYAEYSWMDVGVAAINVAHVGEGGWIDKDAIVSGVDALLYAWNIPYIDYTYQIMKWKSILPDFVKAARPSEYIKKYFHNFNGLEFTEGICAYIDAVLLTDLCRDMIIGSRIGNAVMTEFPLIFVLPTGSTQIETTNQGKTVLAHFFGQLMVPQIKVSLMNRSTSSPGQRTMAIPLERFGTTVLDEFLLPTAFDHFLNQAGIQSLATGAVSSPGKAMENSEGIQLKHPIVFSSKMADVPPDIINRMMPVFLDMITPETAATDEELSMMCEGKLAVEARLAAALWIRENNFADVLRSLTPCGGKMRFKGHQAVIKHLLGGDLAPLNQYLGAAELKMITQKEEADASGLSDEIGAKLGFSMEFYWNSCHQGALEYLYMIYKTESDAGRPLKIGDAMRIILEDRGERMINRELAQYHKSERAAISLFAKELSLKPFSKDGFTLNYINGTKSLMKDDKGRPVPHITMNRGKTI